MVILKILIYIVHILCWVQNMDSVSWVWVNYDDELGQEKIEKKKQKLRGSHKQVDEEE